MKKSKKIPPFGKTPNRGRGREICNDHDGVMEKKIE